PGRLARVWDCGQARRSRAVESLFKEFRRVSGFNTAQTERYDAAFPAADGPIGHCQSMFDRTHIADDVEHPADADSQLPRGPIARPAERGDLIFKRDAPVRAVMREW